MTLIRDEYRVVQWATGNIGLRALRAVIEHPRLRLVGVYVHSDAKAGRDAGELCGLPPNGVKTTRSIDDIIALKPDCVLYMPQGCDFDELTRLLGAGINLITTRSELNNPEGLDPAVRERIEDACRRGQSTIHGTGISPGFITEAFPLLLTSIQRRLDCLRIHEFADVSSRNSPTLLFEIMGFGRQPMPQVDAARAAYLAGSFGPSLRLVARAIGLPLDDVTAKGEVAVASRHVQIAAGMIERGTVAAQRTTISGQRGGQTLLSFSANWYCSTDIDADWDLRETGWHVEVVGDTPLDIQIHSPVPAERWADVSPNLTAHRPVNAVPYVCAATPGIRTTADLPQIIADLRW
ncbi:MAG: dihydrodipicolinate reductase [Polyangiales bacterium]